MSEHLARLVDGGLVEMTSQGRHRYARLTGPDVASALESLAFISATGPARSRRMSGAAMALRAGADVLRPHRRRTRGSNRRFTSPQQPPHHRDDGLTLTSSGIAWFEDLGIDAPTPAKNRPPLRTCLDWTERRPHLAGALAARLADYLLDADWLRRRSPGQRGLAITPHGTLAFDTLLG